MALGDWSTRGTVVHAYGLVAAGTTLELPAAGIDDVPVLLVEVGPVAAVVSELHEDRFGPDEWQRHGQDPRWLETVARAHHEVLQRVAEQADVLPLRLPGIHADEERLTEALHAPMPLLRDALSRLHDHREWGVKVFFRGGTTQPEPPAPRSGREYLTRRSSEAAARDDARARRQAQVGQIEQQLGSHAQRGVVNPPQDRALSGRDEPMLLNAAYLVHRDRERVFLAHAQMLAEAPQSADLEIEVTGPWPAYNFASLAEPVTSTRGLR